jgi:hypothetical protein
MGEDASGATGFGGTPEEKIDGTLKKNLHHDGNAATAAIK